MRYVLGADVGTTRTKCLLFNEEGTLVSSAWRAYPSRHDLPGWCTQNASDWRRAFAQACREALAAAGNPRVEALALATQGGTMVAADENGNPLVPAAVWSDSRCSGQRERFARHPGSDAVWRKTGWELENGMNALQIAWMRENEPELFRQTAMFLSVPSYMSFFLTGKPRTDLTQAGLEQMTDVGAGCYDKALLEAAGVEQARLAPLCESGEIIGCLTEDAAKETGLSPDTLVVAGGHDQALAALGAGVNEKGDTLAATGTCWVLLTLSESRPQKNSVSRAAVKGLWSEMLSMESAGEALEWARELTGDKEMHYEEISRLAADARPGSGGVQFFPYFHGISSPASCPDVRGAFLNLTERCGKAEFFRSVMEGVCYQARWMLESLNPGGKTFMTGGAALSSIWPQILSDVMNREIILPRVADCGCVGAALLAGTAAKVFASLEEGQKLLVRDSLTVRPGENAKFYDTAFAPFKKRAEMLCAMREG